MRIFTIGYEATFADCSAARNSPMVGSSRPFRRAGRFRAPESRFAAAAHLAEPDAGEKTEFKDWERGTPYFEGCMPIEVMAESGLEHSAPRTDEADRARQPAHRPLAPCGRPATPGQRARHLVEHGRLPDQAQARRAGGIFRTIPGLERAEFARLGGIHRNSFINSPRLLDPKLRLKSRPSIRFAGQITGCEGYVESAAIGLIAARLAAAELRGDRLPPPPPETAIGALLAHITGGANADTYQPMNVNFGLMPPLAGRAKKADRKKAYTDRARTALAEWLEHTPLPPAGGVGGGPVFEPAELMAADSPSA